MTEHQGVTTPKQDDEISLKELLLSLQSFWYELWRNWWLIILFCIPFIAFMVYKNLNTPVTYPTVLTFMLNDDEGGSLGNVAGILGSFGLGGSGGGEYNLEKMMELLRSRKIVQSILLKKAKIAGKQDYYANHLIAIYKYHDLWAEDTTGLKDFYFTHDSIPAFSLAENRALKTLHTHVIGHANSDRPALLSYNISELTSIVTLALNTENEMLSIAMLEDLFDALSTYYIEKSTEKQQQTYDAVLFKTDSIYNELRSVEYALANFKDSNYGLLSKKDRLKELQLEGQVKILYTIYGESLKNKEVAEFSLYDRTPVIQAIDRPLSPIEASKDSLLKALIMACLIGGFLGSGFVIARKILRDAMA